VLHLVTAADGAPQYYDSLTNEARYETIEDAIEKDQALREAYMGHPHFHMIANNFSTFDSKIQSAKESVLNILGHQTGSTFFKKYLLVPSKNKNFTKIPINLSLKHTHEVSEQTETFLRVNEQGKNSDKRIIESSIVRTGSNRAYTYTQKTLTEFKG
jgi:hypothetical protein